MIYSNADFSEHRFPYRNKDISLVEGTLLLTLSVLMFTSIANFSLSFFFEPSKIILYITTIILAVDILFILYGVILYATYIIRRILFHNQDKTECAQTYSIADSYCGHCNYLIFAAVCVWFFAMAHIISTTFCNKLMTDVCLVFSIINFVVLLIHIFIDADYVQQHNITTD